MKHPASCSMISLKKVRLSCLYTFYPEKEDTEDKGKFFRNHQGDQMADMDKRWM